MSWLSDMFSPKKQVAPQLKQTPQLKDIAEYPLYRQTLENRMGGIGIGMDPNVLSSNTAPYAKQRMATLNETEIPGIKAAASAAGMGRSTIPVNRIGLAGQAASRDIEERVAQLTLENERQKSTEKQTAISGYGNLLGADYDAANANIASQNAQAIGASTAQNANSLAANAMSGKLMSGIGGAIIGGVTGGPAGAVLGGIGGLSGSGDSKSIDSITSLIDKLIQKKSSAQVNIADTDYSSAYKLTNPYLK